MARMVLPLALLVALAASCAPAEPENLLTNGDFAARLEGWRLGEDATCVASVVPTDVGGVKTALHLQVAPAEGSNTWSINLNQPVDWQIEQGHRLQARVWMRSPDQCRVSIYLEIAKDPWTKSLSQVVTLTPEWQEVVVEGKALATYAPTGANFGCHLAHDRGIIEITGVRLFDLDAPDTPGGARPTMEHPQSLFVNGDFAQGVSGWVGVSGDTLKATPFDPQRPEFPRAMRLEVAPPPDAMPWSVGFGQPSAVTVRKGDAVYFRAWLRSPSKSTVGFIYEMAAAPNSKYISQTVALTPEWREYRFMGRAPAHFGPGQSQAKFFLGYGKGTVEMADVRVENCGKAPDSAFDQTIDYWGGREHNDDWRAPALARIEQIRKGEVTIRVLDANGQPVPGATVRVEQKRHAFRFGTAAPAARFVDTQNPDNLRFQQEVARLFNTVTFENDLKWAATSPATLAKVDQAAQWLKDHDIELRGHCLLWGSYKHLPQALRDLRGQALLDACKQHVTDYATRMKGRVYLWDVVNEAGSNTELWDEIGWEHFADCHKWARAADPDARLCYNDYSIACEDAGYRNKVRKRIEYLLDHGAPVTTLGDQAHLGTPLVRISTALSVWDEWAKFGKDLEVTEFDLGCADDKIHAEYTRDFMTAVFSHPAMKAFIMWGFWEGSHWRAKDNGAMVRRDWTPRPAMLAYEDLVFKQWWTKWQGQSDAAGTAKLRAFYGKHEVTAEAGGKRASAVIQTTAGEAATVEVRLR